MPPRHGKSYLISDHTPAWAISRWAKWGLRVGLAAYEGDFAADWGRKARGHINEHPEFGALIDNTTRAADRWDVLPTEQGGPRAGMNTAGVGGPFTGRGFHVLLVDDPIKNNEWAMSKTIRDKQYNWWGSTVENRLEPALHIPEDPVTGEELYVGNCVVLVNTRWHEDDLMGRLTSDEPDEWYHLNLKALADEDAPESDPLDREPGAALCPARYDEEALGKIKASPAMGGYWFAAQYQGEPNIEGGGIFKRANFCYWRPARGELTTTHAQLHTPSGAGELVARAGLSRFSTLDVAATVKTTSDWSVLSTFDVTPDRKALLVDRVRRRLESADLEEFVYGHFTRLRPSYVGIEKASFGLTVIQKLQRRGVPVRPLEAKGDKVSRAITAGSLVDAFRFYFPTEADWLEEWEHELLQFPNGAHDDQVDTLSYAAIELAVGPWAVAVKTKEPEDTTMEARIARYIDNKIKGKRNRRHPDLGRV